MSEAVEKFSSMIRYARRAKLLGPFKAAEACGMTSRRLSDIEHGKVMATDSDILAIATAFDLDPNALIKARNDAERERPDHVAELKRLSELASAARELILKDAGGKKGVVGRKLEKKGVCGWVPCPACKKKLSYRISGYNGHVHACCETDGCLCWME